MRFKTDENLPEEFAQTLREEGWDALSVYEQNLGGNPDPRIAEVCIAEARVLITLDLGFANIKAYPPHDTPGTIVLRLKRQDKLAVLEVARRLASALRLRPIVNQLWVVDHERIRVRS
jgi:predicted nuclease of predicted toxin-antitoxin system